MRKGGDILAFKENLETEFARLQKTLPLGHATAKVPDLTGKR